ncbi:hypothetical protein M0805_003669 [Coniferiporia weirii]|nr:hypothetical protein M0805_003669 [Coniferiporia weirii]
MSTLLLATVAGAFNQLLQPIPPFTWFGLGISALDLGAALRLCIVLRQLREMELRKHLKLEHGDSGKPVEKRSYTKFIATTLVVVYGGEAFMGPWLGVSPSFVYSPVVPALYAAITALVEWVPWLPDMSFKTEFPLSFFDGITRAFLLCQLIPPAVTAHAQPAISSSAWALLLTSLVSPNGGFFFVNLFSMMHPTGWALTTPAELRAYGWTTIDIWCAPAITGLYALLTHAQPVWADVHALLVSPEKDGSGAEPVDADTARAACAILLASLFVTRSVRNFGGSFLREIRGDKKRVIRSKVDGRRLKVKAQ